MSVSSIGGATAIVPTQPIAFKPPNITKQDDDNDSRLAPPPPRAPLPPGQGTQIDQLA